MTSLIPRQRHRRPPEPPTGAATLAGDRRKTRLERNIAVRRSYVDAAGIAGPSITPQQVDQPVTFRRTLSIPARLALTLFVLVNGATGLVFIGWLLLPEHVPGRRASPAPAAWR